MRREAQALLLLLGGGVLVRVGLSGTATRYLRPGLAPLVVGTGLALVLLAVASLWLAYRPGTRPVGAPTPSSEPPRGSPPRAPDHMPAPGSANGWPLLAAFLVLLVLAPPALGAWWSGRAPTAAPPSRRSVIVIRPTVVDASSSAPAVRMSLSRFVATAAYLHGRRVVLTGSVLTGSAGRAYLVRLAMGCCAAGSVPVRIGLLGVQADPLGSGGWVEVQGFAAARPEGAPVGDAQAYLQVVSTRAIATPDPLYERM